MVFGGIGADFSEDLDRPRRFVFKQSPPVRARFFSTKWSTSRVVIPLRKKKNRVVISDNYFWPAPILAQETTGNLEPTSSKKFGAGSRGQFPSRFSFRLE